MTKQEAIDAMKQGKKVTHKNFTKNEWMTMEGWKMIFEDGNVCHSEEFWRWRTGVVWLDGYSIKTV